MLDIIFNGKGSGRVAQKLLQANMNVGVMRPWIEPDGRAYLAINGEVNPTVNATLRKDEWKHLDEAVIRVAQDRLVVVADLNARGLTYSIPNGMGTTVLEYEDMSDVSDAEMTMDGAARTKSDRPEFDLNYLPLPIVHADFQYSARVLAASRTRGAPLDTTTAELKSRKISEKLEDLVCNGTGTYTFGGGTIYGFTNHPDRNTYTLTAHWNDSAATGETILADVLGMKQALINDGFYGPYGLYIPTNFETALDEDFKSNSDKSVRSRLMEVDQLTSIKVADKLTADNVVMCQLTSDVVRMVNALPLTPVEWEMEGGLVTHFKLMTIQIPQIRSDQDGNSGVCHGTL